MAVADHLLTQCGPGMGAEEATGGSGLRMISGCKYSRCLIYAGGAGWADEGADLAEEDVQASAA